MDDVVCAYCGNPLLTSHEEQEHAVPATIQGRFTTRTVCDPCNRKAGREIDQPWLNEPFVLDSRFRHGIPDRRGGRLQSSPLARGMTQDGRYVSLDSNGQPQLRNSPVTFDKATGLHTISAATQDELDEATERERKKAARDGRTLTSVRQIAASDRPSITGRVEVVPGNWHRQAAKVALALLADQQPAAWRRGGSAQTLRDAMRAQPAADEVRFASIEAVTTIAAEPATAAVLSPTTRGLVITVSLMGIFGIRFLLTQDVDRRDWAWVSDPLYPNRSVEGPLSRVIFERHVSTGLLDAVE